jgi:hypothetical protein
MFVGMDVHRNRTQICVLDHKGNEVRNRNVANNRIALKKELAGLRRGGLGHPILGDPRAHQVSISPRRNVPFLSSALAGTVRGSDQAGIGVPELPASRCESSPTS